VVERGKKFPEACKSQGGSNTPTKHWKTPISQTGGAKSGAPSANSDAIDPDLQRLIDAWPTLPEAMQAGILAMIAAASKP